MRAERNMKQIQVQIPTKQRIGQDYLAVRVQLVHVKKGMFGLRDKELSFSVVIPDTPELALQLFEEIAEKNSKYGKAFQLDE